MSILAVIIARAGSKGLKNKNMQLLAGKPLVAWAIEHAQAASTPDAVVLTSDGADILQVGKAYGTYTYDRPVELAGDAATVDAAVRHGVSCWEKETGQCCRYVAILYANVVRYRKDLLDRALRKLIETEADSVQSVYPVGKNHPLWMRRLTGRRGDKLEHYQPNEIYRRQDLPPVYMLNSGVLAVTRTSLFDVDPDHPHQFLGADSRAIVTRPTDAVDVDDELDLLYAKTLWTYTHQT